MSKKFGLVEGLSGAFVAIVNYCIDRNIFKKFKNIIYSQKIQFSQMRLKMRGQMRSQGVH